MPADEDTASDVSAGPVALVTALSVNAAAVLPAASASWLAAPVVGTV